jgi:hypothetical protein
MPFDMELFKAMLNALGLVPAQKGWRGSRWESPKLGGGVILPFVAKVLRLNNPGQIVQVLAVKMRLRGEVTRCVRQPSEGNFDDRNCDARKGAGSAKVFQTI